MKAFLEKVSYFPASPFRLYKFPRSKFRFKSRFHYHPELELILIISSSGQRYIGDHIGRFTAGDLVLMGPNLPHMYINNSKIAESAQSIVLQFLPDCLGPDFFQSEELKGVRQLLERSCAGLLFHGKTRDKVADLLQEFAELEGFRRIALFITMLGLLAESREFRPLVSPTFSPSLAHYQGERINRVCELISKKFHEKLTQSEAARLARMSVSSFSRFFRRATNKTFQAFVNEVRIGHACQMLMGTDLTVTEICYSSGFGTVSNFNYQFLKLHKVSPREYRKNWTKNEAALAG